jgi:hypothetical protein
LEKSDARYGIEGESTTVLIRQAAQHEHEVRQQVFATLERRFNDLAPDEMTLVQTANMEELKRLETWLTLCEANIMDDAGKPLFPSKKTDKDHSRLAMTKQQFEEAWGKLPPDVADEIHNKVLEVNIMWGSKGN